MGYELTAHFQLLPMLRMRVAVPLFTLSVILVWTEKNLPCLLPTGSICTVADAVDIMEMDRKLLVIHPQRLHSHHLALPPAPRASNLTPNTRIHKHGQ